MYAFDYQRPTSRDAAKAAAAGADTRYLAGGQSLIQAMRLRLSQSERLVDLGGDRRPEGDQGRRQRRDDRRDGDARERRRQRRRAGASRRRSPSSPAASAIRWCATWERSAARSPTPTRRRAIRPACSAFNATIHTDRRTIAADDFFTGLCETALQPGELITAVAFPAAQKAAYVKYKQQASRFALIGVCVAPDARAACASASPAPRATRFAPPRSRRRSPRASPPRRRRR